jgi:hypothetical protein
VPVLFDGLSSMQRLWLIGLFVLWAAFLFGGFALGRTDARRIRRMPAWTRMASSLTLVLAAISGYAFSRGTSAAGFALLITAGMGLGLVGDLFMAGLLPARDRLIGGLAAFGLGHIAYISAALLFADDGQTSARAPWLGAWLAWLLVGLAGWYVAVYRKGRRNALCWAALVYALLLASTAGFATALALRQPRFAVMAVGAALFLLSDLILAARRFSGAHFYLIDDVVWLTYGPGQMLIVYSIGAALGAVQTI